MAFMSFLSPTRRSDNGIVYRLLIKVSFVYPEFGGTRLALESKTVFMTVLNYGDIKNYEEGVIVDWISVLWCGLFSYP